MPNEHLTNQPKKRTVSSSLFFLILVHNVHILKDDVIYIFTARRSTLSPSLTRANMSNQLSFHIPSKHSAESKRNSSVTDTEVYNCSQFGRCMDQGAHVRWSGRSYVDGWNVSLFLPVIVCHIFLIAQFSHISNQLSSWLYKIYTNFKLVYPLLIPFTMWLHLFNSPSHSQSHKRSYYDTLDLECASSEVKRVTWPVQLVSFQYSASAWTLTIRLFR